MRQRKYAHNESKSQKTTAEMMWLKMEILELRNTVFHEYVALSSKLNTLPTGSLCILFEKLEFDVLWK